MIEAGDVVALLQEIKGVPHVDATAEFVTYGVDSLDLLRLADLLESRTGLTCDIEDLVHSRTATELADALKRSN